MCTVIKAANALSGVTEKCYERFIAAGSESSVMSAQAFDECKKDG